MKETITIPMKDFTDFIGDIAEYLVLEGSDKTITARLVEIREEQKDLIAAVKKMIIEDAPNWGLLPVQNQSTDLYNTVFDTIDSAEDLIDGKK